MEEDVVAPLLDSRQILSTYPHGLHWCEDVRIEGIRNKYIVCQTGLALSSYGLSQRVHINSDGLFVLLDGIKTAVRIYNPVVNGDF